MKTPVSSNMEIWKISFDLWNIRGIERGFEPIRDFAFIRESIGLSNEKIFNQGVIVFP